MTDTLQAFKQYFLKGILTHHLTSERLNQEQRFDVDACLPDNVSVYASRLLLYVARECENF